MNNTSKVKIAMRWILGGWALLLSVFVGVASFHTYNAGGDNETIKKIGLITVPSLPDKFALNRDPGLSADDQGKLWQQKIAAYEKEIAAYEKQVTAYKTQVELAGKSDILARYTAVVTNTLIVYLGGGFFTVFLTWVFANLLAGAAERFTESRQQFTMAVNAARLLESDQEADVTNLSSKKPLQPIELL
jgi:hypothetical protein